LFNDDLHTIKDMVSGYSISDETTKQTIRDVYETNNYLLDPHGAVGYNALQQYLQLHPTQEGLFLETAHPVKFYDVVEVVINGNVPIPTSVEGLFSKKKKSIRMNASSDALKTFLMDHAATPVG
jgi:threonine synthase